LPIVISNASPIINLAIIGRLELLRKFWGKIFIPEAVWQEVVIDGKANFWLKDSLIQGVLREAGEIL
jgi:predicted nucleic acid-binding protein